MNIIEVSGLKKHYGGVKAVDGIDFYVEQGSLFAFLGPNGAGKSTTIDIICTILKPDEGKVYIDGCELGRDDGEIRKKIGAVFQEGMLDKLLSVRENLRIRGGFYGIKGNRLTEAVEEAAEAAGASDFLDRPYGKLSGGQRRRADIARALVNAPKILFLDEPTTGLDPQTRKNVWDTVRKLQKEKGMTIFLTTHYMEEADSADYVVVIDGGKLAAKGTPASLKERYASDSLKLYSQSGELYELLKSENLSFAPFPGGFRVNLKETLEALGILEKVKDKITGFEVTMGDMDDAFIGVTGKEIRE